MCLVLVRFCFRTALTVLFTFAAAQGGEENPLAGGMKFVGDTGAWYEILTEI